MSYSDSGQGAHRHSRFGHIVMADKRCAGAAGCIRVALTVDVEVALIWLNRGK